MRFNDLLHLIAFPWKAHGRPPASGFVIAAKMPDSRALSKFFSPSQPIHTPVRGRLSPQHPLAPQFGVRTEMGLPGEEYLGSGSASLVRQGGVLRQEGFPLGIISLDQPLLGTLEGESQPVQIVTSPRT